MNVVNEKEILKTLITARITLERALTHVPKGQKERTRITWALNDINFLEKKLQEGARIVRGDKA